MRAFVAIIIILLVTITLIVSLSAKPIQAEVLIDEHGPGAWPTYASVADPDIVCIHVLTPNVLRRRAREINHT